MSVRNGMLLLLALSTLLFLGACGGGSSTHVVPPPSGGFSNSSLNGTYVFSVSGVDFNSAPFAIVGAFTANGNGGISGGTLDINDLNSAQFTSGPIPNASISSSSTYSVSVDGRGQANLMTGTATPFGTITLDFVLSTGSHGLVTEFDNNASGSGTLDVQTSGTTPTGSYAFSFSGADFNGDPFATVGNFALGTGGAISSGLEDFNDAGFGSPDETLSGTVVLGPSLTPATSLGTSLSTAGNGGPLIFDVYAIDASHLKFIEMDTFATLSGDAFSQASNAFPTSSTLAFTLEGFAPFSTTNPSPASAGGFMVTDSSGNIGATSTEDADNNGTVTSAPLSFTAQTTASGTGRYTLGTFTGFFGGSNYAAYPYSSAGGGGLLLLEIDTTGSGIMVGAALTVSPAATFASGQGYGLNLTGDNFNNGVEVDDIAEFVANSTGTTVSGFIDENNDPGGTPVFQQTLTGTYAAPDSSGRGAITVPSVNTLNGGLGLTFYTVDGTTFPFIETDGGQVSSGVFVLQNASAAAAAASAHSHVFVVHSLVQAHTARTKKTAN